ncbi:MAG: hypothetical protein A3C30_00345 [Candidatus Levybacteria bacterium RIFCSPHIGHO2_02_FULL_40_18]|nr:MAG: hypothetical protein A2869_04040 [Candidatus Levybacteria bacterium RIFCSPHIGHO2_01_FULL_40_58]OGH27153.1 MAG: hypothetical protein A3C30_00345 [Candidatus Levybacteria bacterium RIFCSPHIGHO2_02_FULL_40_18]OGH31012.1 MAG: hypothetical protein A3E43_04760 [Candidatus Levybacteria bacterium RIFCSPHIGHO2_12_FULL_40_31]OGH41023.1 MAG: hypothetical protein A2894_01975 [Candidatus Levybacteria bacterium RIFCSPLOWO2_01_FULL_40_64]OGH49455.1 MAG: hypothetical protein A3I54_02320 [Candidatus Lev
MKLKEVLTPIPVTKDASVHILKNPVFDFEAAMTSRGWADEFVSEQFPQNRFSALRIAIALGYYNYSIASRNFPENYDYGNQVEHQIMKLAKTEALALGIPHLPTIGFEVESPRKPYILGSKNVINFEKYEELFKNMGFPKNRASSISMWEFSPPPSFSSDVQVYILNQLIAGGFIPSLHDSSAPEDIRAHLDDKLVSLHINIGLPKTAINPSSNKLRSDKKFEIFNMVFALAFTSPLRFTSKSGQPLWTKKSAEFTEKGFGQGGRFEIKDLEARDASVYRLMKEIQLLGACLLVSTESTDEELAEIWHTLKRNIQKAFKARGYVKFPENDKGEYAKTALDRELVRSLRSIITASAHEAKSLLFSPSLQFQPKRE